MDGWVLFLDIGRWMYQAKIRVLNADCRMRENEILLINLIIDMDQYIRVQ